jgi:tetratricopeptide (TPR) repeat protein
MTNNKNPIAYANRMQNSLSPIEATKLWEKIVTSEADNPNAQIGLAKCYAMSDRYSDADYLFSQAVNKAPNNAIFQLVRLRNAKNFQGPSTLSSQLRELIQAFPENGIIRHEAAVYYQDNNQFEEALQVLQPIIDKNPESQGWTLCKLRRAQILKHSGEEDAAENEFLSLLKNNETYAPALNGLLNLPIKKVREQTLRPILETQSSKDLGNFTHFIRLYKFYKLYGFADQAEESQKSFRQHCDIFTDDAIKLSELVRNITLPKDTSNFDIKIWRAWRLSQFEENKWKQWISDIQWRQAVRLLSWKYCAAFPEVENATDNITAPPNIYGKIKSNETNKAVLIAGTHQPPASLLTRHMETYYPAFQSLTYTPHNLICHPNRHFTISGSGKTDIKMLLKKLSQGHMVGIGPDTPKLDNAVYIPFLSGEIRLSTIIPRLSYSQNIPSYAILPYWQDRQYGFDLIALPMPKQGETKRAFIQRWCTAYLAEYEKPLKSSGRLINAKSDSWSTMRFPDQSIL